MRLDLGTLPREHHATVEFDGDEPVRQALHRTSHRKHHSQLPTETLARAGRRRCRRVWDLVQQKQALSRAIIDLPIPLDSTRVLYQRIESDTRYGLHRVRIRAQATVWRTRRTIVKQWTVLHWGILMPSLCGQLDSFPWRACIHATSTITVPLSSST